MMPDRKSLESQPDISNDLVKPSIDILGNMASEASKKVKNEFLNFIISCIILIILFVLLGLWVGLTVTALLFIAVGFIVLTLVGTYGYWRMRDMFKPIPDPNPVNPIGHDSNSILFDQMITEFSQDLEGLEDENGKDWTRFKKQGDLSRLLDGLYSGLLFISRALIKGHLDPLFSGNLMEWDINRNSLRLMYFSGLYNKEEIGMEFPVNGLHGLHKTVASIAFRTGDIQIRNSMKGQPMIIGEQRLRAMMSIPIEQFDKCKSGIVAVLNIDYPENNVFPLKEDPGYYIVKKRAEDIKDLLLRVNRLKLKFIRDPNPT
ncbi:MAG: hypothetical protein J5U17_12850 [Candidatus Methanoperedens sp.]|nr:hypothetical protein [Candidatus Methanoperedens sp.]